MNDLAEPSRADIDALPGPVVLEFGATWCGHCRSIEPSVRRLLAAHPEFRHIKVEDGPGQPLGRSFAVKLWPTLIFLRDGQPIRRIVRPGAADLKEAFEALASGL